MWFNKWVERQRILPLVHTDAVPWLTVSSIIPVPEARASVGSCLFTWLNTPLFSDIVSSNWLCHRVTTIETRELGFYLWSFVQLQEFSGVSFINTHCQLTAEHSQRVSDARHQKDHRPWEFSNFCSKAATFAVTPQNRINDGLHVNKTTTGVSQQPVWNLESITHLF